MCHRKVQARRLPTCLRWARSYELCSGLDRQEFPQLPPELNQLSDHRTLFALNAVILRACDAEPAKRYRDGAALLADLSALQDRPVARSAVGAEGGSCARLSRSRLLGLCAGAGYAWRMAPNPPPHRRRGVATRVISGKSIAVLPFANMSDEKDTNAFFTDGIHEDILTTLTRIAPNSCVDTAQHGHGVSRHHEARDANRGRTRGGLFAGGQCAPGGQPGAGHGPARERAHQRASVGE